MYQPTPTAETNPEELHRIVRAHPLGMLVTHTARGLEAEHLPFLLDETAGPHGTLVAHVARANPVWREVGEGADVMVVFRGPQGYISPNWYPGKAETHRYVPTWNYEVVHAHGRLTAHDDETFVRGVVARLTRRHEATQPQPWKMGDAPADFLADALRQIVGIRVVLTRLDGKRKLGQAKDRRDLDGAIAGLEASGGAALAGAMRRAAG